LTLFKNKAPVVAPEYVEPSKEFTMTFIAASLAEIQKALPFWLSLVLIPFAWIGAFYGGWTVFLLPLLTWYFFSAIEVALGLDVKNADLDTTENDFYWCRFITMIWAPVQFICASRHVIILGVAHRCRISEGDLK